MCGPFDTADWRSEPLQYTLEGLNIGRHQVIQYWERPIMWRLASNATRHRGRVLEVGFGLGISADYIVEFGCDEYWVIEAHPGIAERARKWGKKQRVAVTVLEGYWQSLIADLPVFDGILFDTFPLSPDESSKNHYAFIPLARRLLAPGGFFTYYSDETRHFRAEHLHLILRNYNKIELSIVESLNVPASCEYWRHDHMVIPCLSEPRL
jgi:guanidinoacetate N-methyltransferase